MSEVHHLPPELSRFVGREQELASIDAALSGDRLVSLVGPGGCGKSRLAMRIAARQAPGWTDGVWWVDLALETEPDRAAHRIAASLDVPLPEVTEPLGTLAGELRSASVLLVLDNCEHLLPGVADVVAALLATCPGVGLLTTSQAPLGIAGERVWRVPPMTLADGLELFSARAGIESGDETARSGARRVCDRVDRLPLALELAAGWADALSPQQIADSLADPFQVLEGGPRNAPFRQQTLEGSMRWSHDLLDDEERTLFRRLGAFQPGFGADTVRQVCGFAVLDADRILPALRGLIDKSLVVADTTGPVARYRLLGVVQAYARARLHDAGESDTTHDRHLDTHLALAEGLRPLLDTDMDTWRRRMNEEYANIRAAVEWGLRRDDTTRARRLAAETAWLWHAEGRDQEGMRLLRLAVDRGGAEHSAVQARVQTALAVVTDVAAPAPKAYDLAASAATMAAECGDATTARLARGLSTVGLIARDMDAARNQAIDVRDDALANGDTFVADTQSVILGLVYLLRDEYDPALAALGAASDRLLRRGERGLAAAGLSYLAFASARTGDLDGATGLAEQAVGAAEPLRDFHRIGTARGVLAEVLGMRGRLDEADATLEPIGRRLDAVERPPFIPGWAGTKARLELWRGEPHRAVEWCRREAVSRGREPSEDAFLMPETQVLLAAALHAIGDAESAARLLDRITEMARELPMPRLHAMALEQRAHLPEASDAARAISAHHEVLRIRAEHGLVPECIDSLEALAELELRRGASEAAAILAGAADRARRETGYAVRALTADSPTALMNQLEKADQPEALERGRQLELPEAIAYATRARGPRDRPDSGWESLTPTEQSVVDLAIAGLNNPQIAERLYMSRGTVKAHLGHVYAKLGVANRTELARLAGDRRP